MKNLKHLPRTFLVALLCLSGTVALSACSQNSPEAKQSPSPESTMAASTPATNTTAETPAADATKTEATKTDSTSAEATKTDATKTEATKTESTTTDSSKTDTSGAGSVVDVATTAGNFKKLTQALEAAGLVETLKGEGPFTVFAPTDEAFAALPPGTLEDLLKPENKSKLIKVLTYHVVPKELTSKSITSGEEKTVEGGSLKLEVDSANNTVKVNDAKVTKADIKASNGVIHVVDKVILPPDLTTSSSSSEPTKP
ncbi:MAG: fasciclin domain-containing protein [Oscillatoriaceae bacterium SKW80]|nr:fasciclin domain-containing protein [Oscillatoriaceae bacterium SKYG93]MCX8120667.1 fasciclin domain-containing protein [Oscillatoriaceae bacterium SKW80]MDW8453795.1 fasciclin domain-containing protein [Oscillatoriaceae cyanobacterium SKYGB_i_bin93]HIK27025.1 fasciclin domain-containing protein [Oscillatoriaceae cyanobacterium M7585_C2015_266]